MGVTLSQILALVGKLDDTPGQETPRERFRRFLKENLNEVGQVRDYIEECLRTSGDQYSRAFQDLVNHLGTFLEFQVVFGRYHGSPGQIGFDGHWTSPTGLHVVVEVKTTETYPIKTATLIGYVDELVSEQKIPNWDSALGLYVVGRPDPEVRQLENAILAEKRTHQLRIISVEWVLSLAELINEYDVTHEDILAVLRPSGPTLDPVVDLMARLAAQGQPEEAERVVEAVQEAEVLEKVATETEIAYWLSPVKSDEARSAEEVIEGLVGQDKVYAFSERTPGRKHLKPGDWICFYETGKGVVAHAKVLSRPEKKTPPRRLHRPEIYPWLFGLENPHLYLSEPVVIDAVTRSKLDAFKGRPPNKSWAWFVQATRRINEHDFRILTKQ